MTAGQTLAGNTTGTTSLDQRREDARRYLQQVRALRVHTLVSACTTVLIVAVNWAINAAAGITGDWWAWWSIYVVFGWGLGVAIHGITVRMARARLRSPEREDDQIDALLASL